MLSTLQYRILNACAGLALALLLSNIWLYVDNRGAVAELEQRQLAMLAGQGIRVSPPAAQEKK